MIQSNEQITWGVLRPTEDGIELFAVLEDDIDLPSFYESVAMCNPLAR
jgi:hypothetical protein